MTKRALPTIGSMWVDGPLSWIEILCLTSWRDAGHKVILYTVGEVTGIPSGIERRDARDICPPPFDLTVNARHRTGVYSDVFRFELMAHQDMVWADCDAYCVRALEPVGPYVLGRGPNDRIMTGFMKTPADCPALAAMRAFVNQRCPIQPWRGPKYKRLRTAAQENGEDWGIEDLNWGCSGPKLLHHFAKETGIDRFAAPAGTYFPRDLRELGLMNQRGIPVETFERSETVSVHIYGPQKKWLAENANGLPMPGCYLAMLCDRHNVDPHHAPATARIWDTDSTSD